MRVKYIQGNKKGQVEEVSRNVAFGLIDSGKAILSKDMTPDDITNKQEKTNGKPIILQPDNTSRR
jgi:hypothetical protein